ncbi:hydrogenase nickel incorporation protein HypB [Anaerocolumna jejuensis DSM 15929]|uniref:Hydrogenase nickel incorporation protein HypB n=1 Tax=Anaerocolumna jejuensis DSM 15929 TaxID=1121322 RepID=A0A1M7A562_9FIRM|nr:hydrogenase nickel incorporation protein HypB [Anaerocolumna jejuensis]SHL37872.1 hydrogenase nickel incorporation protein HypB [Anaerocolumna jejuensis DSM 15929]
MNDKFRVLEIKQNVYKKNEITADGIRERLKRQKTFMINLMASPGAGKTTTLMRTIEKLKNEMQIGVMEADIDATVDAEKIAATGAKAIQLHTGGMCHMDAEMTVQALNEFGTEELDLLVLENVGNLVCPAEFDTGASTNVAILSVPEGDDKPLKYPLIFEVCDLILINKIDTKAVFDFDDNAVIKRILNRNPKAKVLFISAKTGQGFDAWISWIRSAVKEWQN